MAAAKKEKSGLEDNFAKLEDTINKLESEDTSLEEAFALYAGGMEILRQCNEQIDKVEKKVLKLSENGTLEEL
ncbi:MAG: exodeoxyribonuclease VII small subunit [Lachnospiraceae bacterium]|nr:exodeoxyribonuclease VII small subunit [Lachnospiraceae bacterium]